MKKPGLFSRIRKSISSTLSDAVESMSDPGQEVALMLDDLAAQIKSAEKDLKQAMVDRKVMERKLEEIEKSEADWQKRAEKALQLGDESLARQALKQKSEFTVQVNESKAAMREQEQLIDQMKRHIKESTARLKSLNLRRGSLMAQARAAKKGVMPGQIDDGGTLSRMSTIEDRIAQLEALNEVHSELNSSAVEEAAVDARLADLAEDDEIDDALAALKAKLSAGAKSLPQSEDDG